MSRPAWCAFRARSRTWRDCSTSTDRSSRRLRRRSRMPVAQSGQPAGSSGTGSRWAAPCSWSAADRSASSDSARVPRRRSTSQRSTSRNRRVPNSRSSTARRSSAPERRKSQKVPCGSIATWVNCPTVMPSSSSSSCWASSIRVARVVHSVPAERSCTSTVACWVTCPRLALLLGRAHRGERVTRSRRPPRVTSRRTCGDASRWAWSLCSRSARCRAPGTRPNSPKQIASSTLVLPAPVGPVSRNSPPSDRASTSMSTVPANGPATDVGFSLVG